MLKNSGWRKTILLETLIPKISGRIESVQTEEKSINVDELWISRFFYSLCFSR